MPAPKTASKWYVNVPRGLFKHFISFYSFSYCRTSEIAANISAVGPSCTDDYDIRTLEDNLNNIPKKLWSLATNKHKQNGVYFKSQQSCIISNSINFLVLN